MNRFITTVLVAAILLAGVIASLGQTRVSLKEQSRNVDFADAITTRPVKTGSTLPALCLVGELFYHLAVAPPANLYGCISVNTWAALGVVGPGSSLPAVAGQAGRVLTTDGASVRWQVPGGDVSGAVETLRVIRLQNRAVADIAPANGETLTWNATALRWQPQTPASGSGTSITLQSSGVTIGNRPAWNVLPGLGLIWALTDTGSALTLQASVDTAVIQTRGSAQSGGFIYCPASGTAGGSQFTCSLAPVLTSYTPGMVLHFQPSVNNAGGTVTLNVDSLGSKQIKLQNGTSDPGANNFVAGQLYGLWYDGTQFRRLW
jgi:hypothetical protein